jgi:hypothetical protein
MSGRWPGKPLQPAELAIILEQRALGHGKELIKRALAREGYQRSTESIRGHLESIKRREGEAVRADENAPTPCRRNYAKRELA